MSSFLVIKSVLVFSGSADTEIYLVPEKEQDWMVSFSGFLDDPSDDPASFQCHGINILHGTIARSTLAGLTQEPDPEDLSPEESYRTIEFTDDLAPLIVKWLFTAESFFDFA